MKNINPSGGIYETHMHTPLCRHASGDPEEYAAAAEKKGLKGIIVTCHSPLPDHLSDPLRMSRDDLNSYFQLVERAGNAWKDRIDVLLGLESDYIPTVEMERWLMALHKKADFHYILGSVHPHLKYYQDLFFTNDARAFQKIYFTHLAMAAESGLFDCLSHPDLVKNLTVKNWNVSELMDHICACLDRIAAAGVAMELNTSGLKKTIPEMNPGRKILKEMHARGIPVVVGADAHNPERVGDGFLNAFCLLDELGFKTASRFRGRVRHTFPIADAITALTAVRHDSFSAPTI